MKRLLATTLLITAAHSTSANEVGDAFMGMCDRVQQCVREEMTSDGDLSKSIIETAVDQIRQQCEAQKATFEASIPAEHGDQVVACFEATTALDCATIKNGEDPTQSLPACEGLEDVMAQ